jgi:hypothetical protein
MQGALSQQSRADPARPSPGRQGGRLKAKPLHPKPPASPSRLTRQRVRRETAVQEGPPSGCGEQLVDPPSPYVAQCSRLQAQSRRAVASRRRRRNRNRQLRDRHRRWAKILGVRPAGKYSRRTAHRRSRLEYGPQAKTLGVWPAGEDAGSAALRREASATASENAGYETASCSGASRAAAGRESSMQWGRCRIRRERGLPPSSPGIA